VSDREIFDAALAFADAAQRSAYLDQACAGDAALRRQIEGLLEMHAQLGSFLESPAVAGGMTVDQSASPEGPGTVIGPYKLLQEIGEGGMGVVWMAEQTQPVQRKVALKIIKAGLDSRHVLARFEAERQALALMDHPNIAKVLDAGTIAPISDLGLEIADLKSQISNLQSSIGCGRPYFVMELVKGQPITQYCDAHRLTPKERLELFVPVCQAIQHAHQKGIIHRDIKPSNVLVAPYDGKPVVKVIDFGVAKATGRRLTEKTLFTEFGQVVGTLEYMSPEQAELNNQDIDTRSDIYSLGVLLYEMLTGSPPFTRKELERVGMLEMLRLIREQEPSKPSTKLSTAEGLPTLAANRGTEPAKLTKLIRGELDWIVMKALEKDRCRRYETANGLAHDIERYLNDEAVQACPPSVRYRLGKFARRHKLAFAMISVVSTLLVLSVLILAISNVRIEKERKQKDTAFQHTTANLRLALKALDEIYLQVAEDRLPRDPARKKEDQELLKKALGFYQQFAEENSSQSPVRLEVTRAHRRAGDIQRFIGDHAAAQEAYRLALVPAQELTAEFPDEPEYAYELAVSQNALAEELLKTDQTPAAVEHFRQAIELLTKLTTENPKVPQYRAALARSHHSLGKLHKQQGERSAAVARFQKALDIQSKLSAEYASEPQYRADLAEIHFSLGSWMDCGVLYPTSEDTAHLRTACELFTKLFDDFPRIPLYRFRLAITLYADPRERQIDAFDQAIARFTKLVADFPEVPDYQAGLAKCYGNLGMVCFGKDDWDGYAKYTRRSLDLATELVAKNPTVAEYKEQLAVQLGNMAEVMVVQREFAEGRKLQKDGITHAQALHKSYPDSPRYPNFIVPYNYFLADIDAALGQTVDGPRLRQEADKVFEETWKRLKTARGPSGAALFCGDVARVFKAYAKIWNKAGNHEQRDRAYQAAFRAYGQAIDLDPQNADVWINRGIVYSDLGQPEPAIKDYSEAIKLDPKNPFAHNNIGVALGRQGKIKEAFPYFQKACDLDPKSALFNRNLGFTLQDMGKLDAALRSFHRTLALDPRDMKARRGVISSLARQREWAKAADEYRKAIAFDPKHAGLHNELAWALLQQERWDEAFAEYDKAIELSPKDANVHNELAWRLATHPNPAGRDLGRAVKWAKKAIELAQQEGKFWNILWGMKAVELARQEGNFWNTLGVAHYRAGDWKAAIEALKKSDELLKGNALSLNALFLAMAYGQLGNKAEARRWFGQALERMENDNGAGEDLGLLLAEAGDVLKDGTIAKAWAHAKRGEKFRNEGKPDKAIAEYREAIRLEKDSADAPANLAGLARIQEALGNLYGEIGSMEDAEAALKDAVKTAAALVHDHPENIKYRLLLGDVYSSLGLLYDDRMRQPDNAEPVFLEALQIREKLAQEHPDDVQYVFLVGLSHRRLGTAALIGLRLEVALTRYDKAMEWLERAAKKGHREARGHILTARLLGANALAQRGEYLKAVEEAETVVREGSSDFSNASCIFCLASDAAAGDAKLAQPDRARLKAQYADRAMEFLRQAVACGLRNVAWLKSEKDLTCLRSRADFQRLVQELELKTKQVDNGKK
jgi:serine/threonine protein kinase/Tfp pilus assembly protein PilF